MDAIKLLKDVVTVAQKSNDIDMIQKVISAQQEVLNMQEELQVLREDNRKLKDLNTMSAKIKRYRNISVITLEEDDQKIMYCSNCWDSDKKIIQLMKAGDSYKCPACKSHGYLSWSPDKINN